MTDEDKTWYVSFYLLLADSMTAFNNQQYRRFPSIFSVEYEVGNWPLTGSMSLVGIRNQGLIIAYVRRLDLLLLVYKAGRFQKPPLTRLTTLLVSNRGSIGPTTTGNSCPSTRLTPASLKPDNFRNHARLNRRTGSGNLGIYQLAERLFAEGKLVGLSMKIMSEERVLIFQRASTLRINSRLGKYYEYEAGTRSANKLLRACARVYGHAVGH